MKTGQLYAKSEYCCGCSACKNACPKQAITMIADGYGFVFPQIDESICIDCGMCKTACSFQSEKRQNAPQKVYAGKTKTTDIKKSASGGIFACLAQGFIENGGTVFGAAAVKTEGGITVKHCRATTKEELIPLLGSKYVQSDIADSFLQAKAELDAGKRVLFSGTPCQVDGLYGFLKKDYENLFTVDLICHGVPSSAMFTDYLKTLEGKSKIENYVFRTKEISGEMTSKITFENGKVKYIPCNMSSYFYLFINGFTYRDSCYACPYATKERTGDITLGDYWGIEKHHPEFDAGCGVSCILINTEKGQSLFDESKDGMTLLESEFEKAAENNAQLKRPSVMPGGRSALMDSYKENGYPAAEKYYSKLAGSKKYVSGLKLTAKKLLKR